jgi:uncharacterized membrane protein
LKSTPARASQTAAGRFEVALFAAMPLAAAAMARGFGT